jgi:hypothetical protein
MKKWLLPILVLMGGILLFGCASNTSLSAKPGMEGYVVNVSNDRFLVVSSQPETFSSTGGLSEFYNAISFSNAPKDIQVGYKVQVWFGAVAESFPGQSRALKTVILPSPKPEGASLAEADAIRKALETVASKELPIIKAAEYDARSDLWSVHIKQGEQVTDVKVED